MQNPILQCIKPGEREREHESPSSRSSVKRVYTSTHPEAKWHKVWVEGVRVHGVSAFPA